jgi:hypothetical protein
VRRSGRRPFGRRPAVNRQLLGTASIPAGTETDNGASRSIDFSDDKGIESAYVVFVEATGNPDVFNVWGAKEAPMVASTAGNLGHTYTVDKWNGSWPWLCDGACTGRTASASLRSLPRSCRTGT